MATNAISVTNDVSILHVRQQTMRRNNQLLFSNVWKHDNDGTVFTH
jgi:hypothetical protein